MDLQVKFKSDMHNNYMVIEEIKGKQNSPYGIKMLLSNRIPGLLALELRVIDNINSYYYDITSRHPISWLYDKRNLNKQDVHDFMIKIINIIEMSREYLLEENSFIINPEYIFLDASNNELSLCYLPGFSKDIREQICSLIEFLMIKVDHKEEGAALLIYSLYKISKEEGYTFPQLLTRLNNEESMENQFYESQALHNKQETEKENNFMSRDVERNVSLPNKVKERVVTEEEIKQYSTKTIVYCCLSIIVTLVLFALSALMGFVYDKTTNGIDYTKAFALLLIIGGSEAYILNYLLNEKHKIVKIQKKVDQIEYKEEDITRSNLYRDRIETNQDSNSEQTVVLADRFISKTFKLIPVDKVKYQDILLTDFPFFIGALKRKVDYSIENHTVSRFHAKLEKISEQFYITDLNSTNGTYVNQERLGINEKKLIQLDDEVTFADVSYRFTLS